MKTKIKTVHEEAYSDNSRNIGILSNYSIESEWKETFPYIYKNNMYIFFDTIIDLIDYMLYGEKKMKRAYMEEEKFDLYYDTEHIIGKFTNILKWVS